MIALVAAVALLGILLGAVAHVPPPLSAAAAAAIAGWLLVFAVRERRARRSVR
ncbi:hypothetical protein [Streptomyces pacificus]|uniref:Small hydrophobic membrane protein n=1 Tax=Streptomyces pacificus TaxID=2705029 RepID=A0A6A0ARJ6_9ACTN|nr:hypothetical protein [Streptomyces pacificus]GFH35579.1 hypothetical protein SCWH03_18000 [Streptomyces pacificus]